MTWKVEVLNSYKNGILWNYNCPKRKLKYEKYSTKKGETKYYCQCVGHQDCKGRNVRFEKNGLFMNVDVHGDCKEEKCPLIYKI